MPTQAWTDFTGGEAGDLGPDGCKPNQFQGRNVMVYRDGSVGPRPGLATVTPTSTSTGTVWCFRGLGNTANTGQANIAFGQNTRIYSFLLNSVANGGAAGAISSFGTISVSATVTTTTQLIQKGPIQGEVAVYGDKIYELVVGASVNPLAASPAAKTASLYGVRLMAANTPAQPKRVYYSAASDATSWPALNFFDVGLATWPISYLEENRQRLTIANEGGEFWAESGVPGVNDVLRRQPRGDLSPLQWHHCARVGESIWFLPLGEDFPVSFTGAVVDKLRYKYLRFTAGTATEYVAGSLPAYESVLFCEVHATNHRALLLNNDAWTYHTFSVSPRFLSSMSTGGDVAEFDSPLLFCDGGSGTTAPAFYAFRPSLDRPAKTGDVFAQPGDASTTPVVANLYSSYLFSKQDHDLRVKSVTVEFFTWNTGSASTNHFDFVGRSVFRYGPTAYKDSKTYSFDEATALTTSDKTDKRVRFTGFDSQPGHAFQWRIDNLRGCAVKAVIVDYDETPSR